MKNPFFSSVADFVRGRDERRFSIEEVTRYFLSRTEALNPSLNVCLSINQNAVNRARQIDARLVRNRADSPLTGYPVMVKEGRGKRNFLQRFVRNIHRGESFDIIQNGGKFSGHSFRLRLRESQCRKPGHMKHIGF